MLNLERKTAYIIVHPDEFAIAASKKTILPQVFQKKLKTKIYTLLEQRIKVIILNLAVGDILPEFLAEFHSNTVVIPNFAPELINAQVNLLRKYIITETKIINKLIITGGWEYACLKHTINNLLNNGPRIKLIKDITVPITAVISYKKLKKKITLELDKEFIF